MTEKIKFASWNYIALLCGAHKQALDLEVHRNQPVYCCMEPNCGLSLPADAYEIILHDVVAMQNAGELTIGGRWKRKVAGAYYLFAVEACPSGKAVEVSVRKL